MVDSICVAQNDNCQAARKIAYGTLWAAKQEVGIRHHTLAEAEAALRDALATVNQLLQPSNLAFLKKDLVIRHLSFDVEISAFANGRFNGELQYTFQGKSYTNKLNFNLKDVKAMALELSEIIFVPLIMVTGRRKRDVESVTNEDWSDLKSRHDFPFHRSEFKYEVQLLRLSRATMYDRTKRIVKDVEIPSEMLLSSQGTVLYPYISKYFFDDL